MHWRTPYCCNSFGTSVPLLFAQPPLSVSFLLGLVALLPLSVPFPLGLLAALFGLLVLFPLPVHGLLLRVFPKSSG